MAKNQILIASKNDSVISAIRKKVQLIQNQKSFTPDIQSVINVVDAIVNNKSLSETAKKLAIKNIKEAEKAVLDIVAVFGTWLTHSEGKNSAVLEQMNLFEDGPKENLIPKGFEPSAYHKRDVLKALARIKSQNPSEEIVSRFVARTYKVRSASLDHAIVAGVWGFAKRERLDRIENVSSDMVFLSQVIEAYDFVGASINSALLFLDEVSSIEITKRTNLNKLHAKIELNTWVFETEFLNIDKYILMAIESDSYHELLVQNFIKFQKRIVEFNLSEKISSIEKLTAGQIKRICFNAGFIVDSSADKRAIELEIRQTLKAMKLSNDQDLLLPEALRAAEKDRLTDFWQILQNRLDGDTTWAEQLQELTN